MNLTPPPSQNSHAVRWHSTTKSNKYSTAVVVFRPVLQFTDTSEHIRFLLFSFSVFHFLVVGSVRQIKVICVGFWAQVRTASRIVQISCSVRVKVWSRRTLTTVLRGLRTLLSMATMYRSNASASPASASLHRLYVSLERTHTGQLSLLSAVGLCTEATGESG